jgi:signal transduction histidine kinase
MADQDQTQPTTQDPGAHLARTYSQLLSLAVHEFRTPISVVSGYLRMLQRDSTTPLAERHRKMIEEAEKSCARLVALVSELNEVSKLEDPLVALHRESFDLVAMIREVAGETTESSDRGVTLRMKGASSGGSLTGDAVRLHAALSALFRAVLREQPDNATVMADCRVSRGTGARTVTLTIARDEDLAGVSGAAAAAFDEKRGGLGLALPIARRVIERHGGRVWSPPSVKGEFGSRSSVVLSVPVGR